MAWRGKDVTILLVDVGRTMRETAAAAADDCTKVSKAEVALRMARNVVQQKLLFMPKHEVGVALFGTQDTCNELAHDGYSNILVARDGKIEAPDLNLLRLLTASPAGGAESDAVNGLIVSIDWLIKKTRELKYNKSIHIFTDGNSAAPGDPDLLECVKQLEATGTRLNVTLVGSVDSGPWGYLAATGAQIALVPMSDLARQVSMCVKPVETRAKVRLPLQISPDVQIPVGVYSRTTRVNFPTLKKRSKQAASVPAEHQKTEAVVVERTYHVADDPDGPEVVAEDRIKGHRYGQSIVPMSEYDEAALMYTCDRVLAALGFAPASSIGPEHSMHQVEAVAADRGDPWAYTAFESLVDAMISENVALIARYCYRKNAQPKMVALMPRKGTRGVASILDMQYLPFFEDIREWSCTSLPTPGLEQRTAVAALVDAMNLDSDAPALGEHLAVESQAEALRPEDTHNPALTRFYNFLVQRALRSSSALSGPGPPPPALPPEGPEGLGALALARPQRLDARLGAAKVAEQLKLKFGLEKVEKAQGKKKRFWREAIADKRKEAAFGEVDTKRIKVPVKEGDEKEEDKVKDEDGAASASAAGMAAPVGVPPRVHIGSVHPERDFEKWLAHRSGGIDAVGEAVQQMRTIVERFAEEGEDYHGKALSCLAALRRGCAQEGEVAAYNDFARSLSLATSQRRMRFWEKAREARLGLITDAEVPTSTVTAEEARAFLAGEAYFPASSSAGRHGLGGTHSGEAALTALSERDLEAMLD